MKIRDKLILMFLVIVMLILGGSSLATYIFSSQYRRAEFYDRMSEKAHDLVKLLIEVGQTETELLHVMKESDRLHFEEIVIFDYKDSVIFSSYEERVKVDKALLKQIHREGEVRLEKGDTEVLGFLYTDRFYYKVIITARDIYGFTKLEHLRNVLLIIFCVGILITLVLGFFFARRVLEPISTVIKQVDKISISSLDMRLDEGNGKDEIERLSGTFNKMLGRLENAFQLEKNFIVNASHELRTPLTVITGQLEVTLAKEREKSEYQNSIKSVLEDIKNINYLANRLLLLAQASADTIGNTFQPVRVDELVWQSASELKKSHSNYQVSISFQPDMEDSELTIQGNEHLIKVIIFNLMDNGCKYSTPPKVSVNIFFKNKRLFIAFTDQGIGISEEDKKLIFQPFHRGENVSKAKGHGIGLSLVKRIIDLHHGNLNVASVKGQGSTFTISFPKIPTD